MAIESELVLGKKVGSYMLMNFLVFDSPKLQEQLGQLRTKEVAVATKSSFDTDPYIVVSSLYKRLASTLDEVINHYVFIKITDKKAMPCYQIQYKA